MNFTFCYVKAGNCTYWQDLLVHAALTISPNTTTAGRNIKAGNCTYWQDLLVHAALTISPNTTTALRGYRTPHSANLLGSRPHCPFP